MITKEQIKVLKQYSFIKDIGRKNTTLFLYYEVKGEPKFKKLPLRSHYKKILETMKKIKQEVGGGIYGKGYNSEYYII